MKTLQITDKLTFYSVGNPALTSGFHTQMAIYVESESMPLRNHAI